jgi:hypothetical protein
MTYTQLLSELNKLKGEHSLLNAWEDMEDDTIEEQLKALINEEDKDTLIQMIVDKNIIIRKIEKHILFFIRMVKLFHYLDIDFSPIFYCVADHWDMILLIKLETMISKYHMH